MLTTTCLPYRHFFTFTLLPASSALLQTPKCSEYHPSILSPVVALLSDSNNYWNQLHVFVCYATSTSYKIYVAGSLKQNQTFLFGLFSEDYPSLNIYIMLIPCFQGAFGVEVGRTLCSHILISLTKVVSLFNFLSIIFFIYIHIQ